MIVGVCYLGKERSDFRDVKAIALSAEVDLMRVSHCQYFHFHPVLETIQRRVLIAEGMIRIRREGDKLRKRSKINRPRKI